MTKKIKQAITVLFIAGALSGSINAMEESSTLKSLVSTQNNGDQELPALPFVLAAGLGAYLFREELKSGLTTSVRALTKVCRHVWNESPEWPSIPWKKLIPGHWTTK